MAVLSSMGKFKNTGLLLLRIGLGFMFIMHGYPKLLGGTERWELLGQNMGHIGIHFMPVVWGFAAAVVETFGGILFIFGLWFRPVSLLLCFTMLIAALRHLAAGDGLMGSAHAIEIGIVFLGLSFVGPGRYSIDKR